jgi:hypothetical protein
MEYCFKFVYPARNLPAGVKQKIRSMNSVYLVHITLPESFTGEFYGLIKQQRELIAALMDRRTVLSYSLDMERKNVWCVLEVSDQKELAQILKTFPILNHVELTVHELAFHDAAPVALPDLILN